MVMNLSLNFFLVPGMFLVTSTVATGTSSASPSALGGGLVTFLLRFTVLLGGIVGLAGVTGGGGGFVVRRGGPIALVRFGVLRVHRLRLRFSVSLFALAVVGHAGIGRFFTSSLRWVVELRILLVSIAVLRFLLLGSQLLLLGGFSLFQGDGCALLSDTHLLGLLVQEANERTIVGVRAGVDFSGGFVVEVLEADAAFVALELANQAQARKTKSDFVMLPVCARANQHILLPVELGPREGQNRVSALPSDMTISRKLTRNNRNI